MQPPEVSPFLRSPVAPVGAGRSGWPKAIGVISIVFASLGLVCVPLSGAMTAFAPHGQARIENPYPGWYTATGLAMSVAQSALLLAAGVSLIKRRPRGRTLHVVYAGVGVGHVLASFLLILLVFPTPDVPGPAGAFFPATAACSTLAGAAYPIFLLIWFMRPAIRNEVESWRSRAATADQ